MSLQFKIAAFYEFKNIDNLYSLSKSLKSCCKTNQILGSIIIAKEGINGTVAGISDSIDKLVGYIHDLGFCSLNIKYSETPTMPFYRSKIKIKKEIIAFLDGPIDSDANRADSVSPQKWNELISCPDVITIDVRNDYETKLGSFKNATSPRIKSFMEFKKYIDTELSTYKQKKIAMYCTGGIRCEKASYYMRQIGFKEIFQLNGGILKYMEDIADEKSLWEGECFVFDNRVTVTSDLVKGSYELCRGCDEPISELDKASDKFEKDVSCPNCYDTSSQTKKDRSRERSKQISLADKRKTPNVYLPKKIEDYMKTAENIDES